MKISKLNLKDFRCHPTLTAEALEKINYFIGPNAAGKSSIQQAIEFALTGRCSAAGSPCTAAATPRWTWPAPPGDSRALTGAT